jgi:enoyl-CoA hydratase/carnithine racemase
VKSPRLNTLDYHKRDGIGWITLSRPDVMNAVDRQMNDELWDVWRDVDRDPNVAVAILTGAGDKAFCAGADLADYIGPLVDAKMQRVRHHMRVGLGGITRGLHRVYKPIIGAINGWALAGGFELALACDIRIASTAAVFGSFEVRRGFHHGDGGIVRLVAMLGLARALDIVLTGREIDATEALRIGLVSAVVPPGELRAAAESYARRIMANSQPAVRSAKETILDVLGRPLDDALRIEAVNGYTSGDPAEVRERVEGFLQSRQPDNRKPSNTRKPKAR